MNEKTDCVHAALYARVSNDRQDGTCQWPPNCVPCGTTPTRTATSSRGNTKTGGFNATGPPLGSNFR